MISHDRVGCAAVQIEDWCEEPFKDISNNSSRKDAMPVLQLEVPPGQLDLGRRLVQVIYSSSPDLSDLTPKQLLQLAGVADKYMVGKALAAAGEALQQVDWENLSCEEAAAVFEVPDAGDTLADHQEVVGAARAAAAERLAAVVGDLEVAWHGYGSSSQQLLLLPAEALLHLLRQQHFAATSEDTVYHTVAEWLAAHPDTPAALQRCLAQELHLADCTPTYFTEVVCHPSSWLMQLGNMSPEEIARTSAMCSLPKEQRKMWMKGGVLCARPPAPVRKPSFVTDLTLEWVVPVDVLQGAPGTAHSFEPPGRPEPVFWQGRTFELGLKVDTLDDRVELSLMCQGAPAVCAVQCDLVDTVEGMPLTVAPQSGSLGAPQLLGLAKGRNTSLVSFHVQPTGPEATPPGQWWCPLEARFVVEDDKFTHVKLRAHLTAVH
jgi:hypothetical protein